MNPPTVGAISAPIQSGQCSPIDPSKIVIAKADPAADDPPDSPVRPDVEYWHGIGLPIIPLQPGSLQPAVNQTDWDPTGTNVIEHFDVNPDHLMGAILPKGLFAFEAWDDDVRSSFSLNHLKPLELIPVPTARGFIYRTDYPAIIERISRNLPDGVGLRREGDIVLMRPPERFKSPGLTSLDDLSCWTVEHIAKFAGEAIGEIGENVPPAMEDNPFARFNVTGSLDALRSAMLEAKPLLGNICLMGQATMIYAPPNTGKTLIVIKLLQDAVRSGRVHGPNVVYFNADDTSSGLVEKAELLADLGVNMIAPGHKGMKAANIMPMLQEAIAFDNVYGLVLIFDTVKKLASLMDKKESSAFADICRQAVSKGATILGLGHTNKNANSRGKSVYAGTTDILDDFDAGYIINRLDTEEGSLKFVEFENVKRRGNNADGVMFLYDCDPELSYERRLASVTEVDPEEAEEQHRLARLKADQRTIDAICMAIRDGDSGKMALIKATAKSTGLSERKVMDILDRYSGDEPGCFWRYERGGHGKLAYSLLN